MAAREVGGLTGAPDPIRVWRFREAPAEYQRLSPHGGDEDWLALVPPRFAGDLPAWMYSGTAFGCSDVSEHRLGDGSVVCIGAHA